MKVFVTGASGFVGSYLCQHLKEQGHEVIAGTHSKALEGFESVSIDIGNAEACKHAIKEANPEVVFHLAAQAYVPESFSNPESTYQANFFGTLHVLEAVRALEGSVKTVVIGSSESYGKVEEHEIPIKETALLRPLSPYGVSKAAADLLAYQYSESYGLDVVRLRPFNHTGPKRKPSYVVSDWCKQVADIEKGKQEAVINVGNLSPVRDFTDVRDMVQAYRLAAEKGKKGEAYNVCSGKGIQMQELLNTILSFIDKKIQVNVDKTRVRKIDLPVLIGDNTKFIETTGWKPAIPFKQTVEDILAYWRENNE